MTLITTIPVLCALIGLLMYGFTTNHKHLGMIAFACGLFHFLAQVASKTIHW